MTVTSTKEIVRLVPVAYNVTAHQASVSALHLALGAAEAGSEDARNLTLAAARSERALREAEEAVAAVDGRAPTYLVRPPTLMERREFRVRLAERGADNFPTEAQRFAMMRRAIGVLVDLGDIDTEVALGAIGDAESAAATGDPLTDDLVEVVDHLDALLRVYPPYAQMVRRRLAYFAYAPAIAAQMFLAGWEDVALTFRRTARGVPDDLLEQIPSSHLEQIGQQAIMLMAVSETQAKNSASPLPSLASPKPTGTSTAAATTTETAAQPTAAAGSSPASTTTSTPA